MWRAVAAVTTGKSKIMLIKCYNGQTETVIKRESEQAKKQLKGYKGDTIPVA